MEISRIETGRICMEITILAIQCFFIQILVNFQVLKLPWNLSLTDYCTDIFNYYWFLKFLYKQNIWNISTNLAWQFSCSLLHDNNSPNLLTLIPFSSLKGLFQNVEFHICQTYSCKACLSLPKYLTSTVVSDICTIRKMKHYRYFIYENVWVRFSTWKVQHYDI